MTYLLPLQPENLGTPDVEALASLLARLSLLHGVSNFQLSNHLQAWT